MKNLLRRLSGRIISEKKINRALSGKTVKKGVIRVGEREYPEREISYSVNKEGQIITIKETLYAYCRTSDVSHGWRNPHIGISHILTRTREYTPGGELLLKRVFSHPYNEKQGGYDFHRPQKDVTRVFYPPGSLVGRKPKKPKTAKNLKGFSRKEKKAVSEWMRQSVR